MTKRNLYGAIIFVTILHVPFAVAAYVFGWSIAIRCWVMILSVTAVLSLLAWGCWLLVSDD